MLFVSFAVFLFKGRPPTVCDLYVALRPAGSSFFASSQSISPTDLHLRFAAFCLHRLSERFVGLVGLPLCRTRTLILDGILHILFSAYCLAISGAEMDVIAPMSYGYFAATAFGTALLLYWLVFRRVPSIFGGSSPDDRWTVLLVLFYMSANLAVLCILRYWWYYLPHSRQLNRGMEEFTYFLLHVQGLSNAILGLHKTMLEVCLRQYIQDPKKWSQFRMAIIEQRIEVGPDQQLVVIAHPPGGNVNAQPERRTISAMQLTHEELTAAHFEYMYWLSEMWTDEEYEQMQKELAARKVR